MNARSAPSMRAREPTVALPADVPSDAMPPGVVEAGEVGSFTAVDGEVLRFQVVRAARPQHHLLYLHGIESHGGWFLPAARALRQHGCTTWLFDRRGSGLNRDLGPGDAPSATTLLADVGHMRARIGAPVHLVGLSWGGKLATVSALDDGERVHSLILITPGLVSAVDLTLLQKVSLAFDLLRGGRRRFSLPIRPEMFTRTPEILEFVRRDPWRVEKATSRLLWASRQMDRHVRRGIHRLQQPVLLFLAGRDRIIDNAGVLHLLSTLPAGQLSVRRYDEATHSIQLEQTAAMVADILTFLQERVYPC